MKISIFSQRMNIYHYTKLAWAISVALMLIENNVDVSSTDEDGRNALNSVSMKSDDSILNYLLSLTEGEKIDFNRQSTTGVAIDRHGQTLCQRLPERC